MTAITIDESPRKFRRWFAKYARKLMNTFVGLLFAFTGAMYLWKLYLDVWPLLLPLAATNPAFLYATLAIAGFGAIFIIGAFFYVLFA